MPPPPPIPSPLLLHVLRIISWTLALLTPHAFLIVCLFTFFFKVSLWLCLTLKLGALRLCCSCLCSCVFLEWLKGTCRIWDISVLSPRHRAVGSRLLWRDPSSPGILTFFTSSGLTTDPPAHSNGTFLRQHNYELKDMLEDHYRDLFLEAPPRIPLGSSYC